MTRESVELVKLLRNYGAWLDREMPHPNTNGKVIKAANLIEQQQAEIERLKKDKE